MSVPTEAPTAPPAELLLRPGVPVVRRDADTLQVGLHPPLAVRLPDTADVRALLDSLRTGTALAGLGAVATRALDTLREAGLALLSEPEALEEVVTARAQFGADAVRRLAARSSHGIGVRADRAARAVLHEMLDLAGLVVDDAEPVVRLVVVTGQLSRESLDPLVRAGVPHLLVTGDAAARRIGPFVEPGRTACLRCVDAHEAVADPRRPFLLEQAARAADRTESPVDPVLDRMALAWAVRDLCRYLEGDEPSTWSATVDLGPTDPPRLVRWLRHPHCGCAWDLLSDLP